MNVNHPSYKCKCKYESKRRNSSQTSNKSICKCGWKNPRKSVCEKNIVFGITLDEVMKMVDMQKPLLAIQRLCVMKLKNQQKVLWQKLFQQKVFQ